MLTGRTGILRGAMGFPRHTPSGRLSWNDGVRSFPARYVRVRSAAVVVVVVVVVSSEGTVASAECGFLGEATGDVRSGGEG